MKQNWKYHRGDLYMADLSPVCGSEQGGVRPVIVIQNNTGNQYSPTLIVAAVTAQKAKKAGQPTHYLLRNNPALPRSSVVLLEQLRTIDKHRIQRYLGKIDQAEMQKIDSALLASLGLKKYLICGDSGQDV